MTDPVGSFIDGLNAALDGLALLPLAFIAVLGFFVIATVVLEDTPSTAAASVEIHLGN